MSFTLANSAFAKVEFIFKNVTILNDDVMNKSIPDGTLVYLKSNNTQYLEVYIGSINLYKPTRIVGMKGEYCMWSEFTSSDIAGKHKKYGYKKIWSPNIIISKDFKNKKYKNPFVELMPEGEDSFDMKAGDYIISNNLTTIGQRELMHSSWDEPINENFTSTRLSEQFEYASRGIFYSPRQRGNWRKFMTYNSFWDLYNKRKGDTECVWCTPGDRRLWFEVFTPNNVTVIGMYINGTINATEISGYKIGAVYEGEVDMETIKDNLVNDNYSFYILFDFIAVLAMLIFALIRARMNDIKCVGIVILSCVINWCNLLARRMGWFSCLLYTLPFCYYIYKILEQGAFDGVTIPIPDFTKVGKPKYSAGSSQSSSRAQSPAPVNERRFIRRHYH